MASVRNTGGQVSQLMLLLQLWPDVLLKMREAICISTILYASHTNQELGGAA